AARAKARQCTCGLIAEAVRFRPDSAGWKWEVQVINDPKTVNAFCMAGGKMAIYTGMVEPLKLTEDELAQDVRALEDHRGRARPGDGARDQPGAPRPYARADVDRALDEPRRVP